MAVRKLKSNSSLSPADRMQMDRVQRAKKAEPKRDARGIYAEKCAELAEQTGVPAYVIMEEHDARAGARYYDGVSMDEAEAAAWSDVVKRFEVDLAISCKWSGTDE